jgi:phage terminase large subunit
VTDRPAATKLREWRERPVQMVEELFGATPDPKQRQILDAFPHNPLIAMKSCTGAGKTATLAWIGWNFLLTRPHPIMGACSVNGDNLFANLWPELSRWRAKSPLLMHAFDQTGTAIFNREHPRTWRMEARTWSRSANAAEIGNALRGLHGEYIMWLCDEAGGYPDGVLPVLEAIFSGSPKEAHIVLAGNPTQTSGALYVACVMNRKFWLVIEITADPEDPERTPRVSVEHAMQQIEQYGRDNPWVQVNIFGKFPPTSFNALLGPEEVRESFERKYREHDIASAPRILGVDVAREGDDASCIFPRQGLVAFKPHIMRNVDGTTGGTQVAKVWDNWSVDAVFLDASGGHGDSWYDQLARLNRTPTRIKFNDAASEGGFSNIRTEMYWSLAQWVKKGGCLPNVPELISELSQTTYTYKGDKIALEPKDMIKKKLGRSPDISDALALTWAAPVAPRLSEEARIAAALPRRERNDNYDPIAEFMNRR